VLRPFTNWRREAYVRLSQKRSGPPMSEADRWVSGGQPFTERLERGRLHEEKLVTKAYLFHRKLPSLIQHLATATRPFGITLLAVLHVLQAILFLIGAIALIVIGTIIRRGFFGMHRLLSGAAWSIGVVVLVIGLLYLGLAWGLWNGKGWAWAASLILAGIGLVVSLISLAGGAFGTLFVLILDTIIIYYLLTVRVRAYFGELKHPRQSQPPTQQVGSASQPTVSSRFCSNCGAPAQLTEKFCSHCGKAFQ